MVQIKLIYIRWVARIIALFTLLFALPFYFGYGNPLPFINSNYTFWDNMWLTFFPIIFLGLILGFKYEEIGGYLVSIPLIIGILFGLIANQELLWFMLIPLLSGVLYFFSAYKNNSIK